MKNIFITKHLNKVRVFLSKTLVVLGILNIITLFSKVNAQDCDGVDLGSGGPLGNICLGTFVPYQGIASGGLLSALATIFQWMFIVLLIMWVIALLFTLWDYIRSQGDQQQLETAWQGFQYIWRGISLVLIGFIIVTALGVFGGLGSPLKWADNLYQCGGKNSDPNLRNEIYARAEDRIRGELVDNAAAPGDYEIYCCQNDSVNSGLSDGWINDPSLLSFDIDRDCKSFGKVVIE